MTRRDGRDESGPENRPSEKLVASAGESRGASRRTALALLAGALAGPSLPSFARAENASEATGGATATGGGTLTATGFVSQALGREMRLTIYRPAGTPPEGGWRVLYLLHGLDGTETDWEGAGTIGPTLDRLIGSGAIQPLLVVMPGAGNSWYVDSADVGGVGNMETALTVDLPRFVETSERVRTDRNGRAIAGLSMGGFGALRLSLAHPELYLATAALSPAMWQNVPLSEIALPPERTQLIADSAYFHRLDPVTLETGIVLPPAGPHFDGAFGTPFDARRFNRENVFTLLADRVGTDTTLPAIFVTVGDDDSHKLWRGAIAFYETMQADGRTVEFRVTDGDHTWDLWRISIVNALAFIDAAMRTV